MTAADGAPFDSSRYLTAMEQSCQDLPAAQRQTLLTDLEAHLREIQADPLAGANLPSPVDYASELRTALGLPDAPGTAGPRARTRLRGLAIAAVLAAAAALATGVGVIARTRHTNQAHPSPGVTFQSTAPAATYAPVPGEPTGRPITLNMRAIRIRIDHVGRFSYTSSPLPTTSTQPEAMSVSAKVVGGHADVVPRITIRTNAAGRLVIRADITVTRIVSGRPVLEVYPPTIVS